MTIGFYDDEPDVKLPHPPIPLAAFLIVENAICAAWQLLLTKPRPGFDLLTEKEDVVTQELHEVVFNRIFNEGIVEGFDRQLFTILVREPKLRNYDYSILDKMPDLLIALVDRPAGIINSQYGIFMECKPVDATHTVGKHYCNKGLIRFVNGDYAWAMTSALMIGYVRKGYTILPKLVDALKRSATIKTIKEPYICSRSRPGPKNEVVHISKHARTFTYQNGSQHPGPITIRHLWLSRD